MNKVFGLVKQIDSRPEFSKNGSRPIFAAKRHENSMKPIFRRNKPTIRQTAFLLLFSMLLSVLTVFPSFAEGSSGEVTPQLPDTALSDASLPEPDVNIESETMQTEAAAAAVASTPVINNQPIAGQPCIMEEGHFGRNDYKDSDTYWCNNCINEMISNKDKY